MGLKTLGETMQLFNNSSRRCVHVSAIFSPPGCALPKWGVGREAIVFTTRYVMQQGAKAGQTVGVVRGVGEGWLCWCCDRRGGHGESRWRVSRPHQDVAPFIDR